MPLERYRTKTALKVTGVTARQLDYWVQLGLVRPRLSSAAKRPNRLYSHRDLVLVRAIAELRSAGISLQEIRAVSQRLSSRRLDLASTYLVCAAGKVYEYGDDDVLVSIGADHGQLAFMVVALQTVTRQTDEALAREVRKAG